MTRSVTVDFRKARSGTGWHPREATGDGRFSCWTGPHRVSTLELRLPTEVDLRLAFHVLHSLDAALLTGVQLRVNGVGIELTRLYLDSDGRSGTLQGRIPAAALRAATGDRARIEFEVSATLRPRDLDPSTPDERELGLNFSWIDITPWETGPPPL